MCRARASGYRDWTVHITHARSLETGLRPPHGTIDGSLAEQIAMIKIVEAYSASEARLVAVRLGYVAILMSPTPHLDVTQAVAPLASILHRSSHAQHS